jgi:hypothetical protein
MVCTGFVPRLEDALNDQLAGQVSVARHQSTRKTEAEHDNASAALSSPSAHVTRAGQSPALGSDVSAALDQTKDPPVAAGSMHASVKPTIVGEVVVVAPSPAAKSSSPRAALPSPETLRTTASNYEQLRELGPLLNREDTFDSALDRTIRSVVVAPLHHGARVMATDFAIICTQLTPAK